MDHNLTEPSKGHVKTIFFLILFVTFANFYLYIGFALKPYMLFCFLYLVFFLKFFRLYPVQLFESALFCFYLCYAFSGVFALYPMSSVRISVGIFIYLVCYFIMKSVLGRAQTGAVHKGLAWTGVIFNLCSLLFYVAGMQKAGFNFDREGERITAYGLMIDRDYPRLIGLLQDPNFFVFYNTLFFAFYLCNPRGLLNKTGLLLCITANILTFSRGGLLVMLVLFLIYGVIHHPLKQLKMILGAGLSMAFLSYVLVIYFKFDLYGILESRMEDFGEDGGSGRFELWGKAWGYFENHIVTGVGAFNFPDYNAYEYGEALSVHNTFLDIISESGLPGIFLYLLFILLLFYQLVQKKVYKDRPYLFLTFIGLLLQMAFLSVIINDMFFLYLALVSTYLHKRTNAAVNERGESPVNRRAS